ncbi:MAG: hypothetical protein AAFO81_12635 [Pseudomonadota bacterium]
MSGRIVFERHYQAMRGAQLLVYVGIALPLCAALVVALWPTALDGAAIAALAVCALLSIILLLDVVRRARRVTRRRIAMHLDRQYAQLEDSATLLLARQSALSPVARLQRQRVAEHMLQLQPALRGTASHRYRWQMALASGLVGVALILNAPRLLDAWSQAAARQAPATAVSPRLERVQFDVAPPAYMQRAAFSLTDADITIPVGSRVRITAHIAAASNVVWSPNNAGDVQPLYAADQRTWQSEWWQAGATTYALLDNGEPIPDARDKVVHRIAIADDAPPDVNIVVPTDRVHTVSETDSAPLQVTVDVADDYGVTGIQLVAVLSEGDGEQVSFARNTMSVFSPDAAVPAYTLTYAVDAHALGLQPGGELYVSFVAHDNREPIMQSRESATLILRWPDAANDVDMALDNQIVAVMPEYFRSQRQLIIDTEALLANAAAFGAEQFAQQAQELALDQQALRLRYGAFLGEESGGEPAAGAEILADEDEHYVGDGHDHSDDDFVAAAAPGARAGDAAAAIAPYAHVHDQEEQATLFDPQTRELLRGALSAMWQSERLLRQHTPQPSLPHQYRALALIKQVQKRSRVFVDRIGFEPRPIDMARRLTGELDDIDSRTQLAAPVADAAADSDVRATRAMQRLLSSNSIAPEEPLQDLFDWLQRSGVTRDATARAAFLDAEAQLRSWQQQRQCASCRERLDAFWHRYAPRLERLPARNTRRENLFGELP